MTKEKRIQEIEKLLKNLKVDKQMALNAHQYELVANFRDYEKQLIAEKEFLEKDEEDNILI